MNVDALFLLLVLVPSLLLCMPLVGLFVATDRSGSAPL